jgi:ribonuclease HI
MKYVLRMSFPNRSNNEAEYEALLHGMRMAKACGATRLKIFGDSNWVVQQVMNLCDALSDNMTAYRNLYYYLEGAKYHISRSSNEEADTLARVFWEEIIKRSIKNNKPSSPKKIKKQSTTGSGAEPAQEEHDDTPEPEEIIMIEVT